ncbi:MAG TPA: ABC transporter ATP-binding protein, partial [Chthoniobacteraceae bacterium]|nr:ABC transporter ATP-binding protein [Chthoniobacteraceae bacterium]
MKRYPLMALGTLGCAIAGTLMVVVFPMVIRHIINDVIGGHQPGQLVWWVCIGAAAFLGRNMFNSLRLYLNNTFEQKVIFDLRSDLYSHIQQLPLTWFDDRATGDLMTRVLEDVTSVERVLIDGIELGVVSVLQVIAVCVLLFSQNAKLALVALIPIPFLIAGALAYTLTAHNRYRIQRKAASAMNSVLHDNLAGIRQIKTYVREGEEHARFNERSNALRESTLVVMRVWAIYSPTMEFLASCGQVLIIGFGGADVMAGTMRIGDLVYFLMLAQFLYDPAGKLHQLNQLIQGARAAGERVFEIMDEKVEAVAEAKDEGGRMKDEVKIAGDVRFQNVSFAYDETVPVLRNINLHAKPGETIALVGATGAGKTTLVNLITRFYEYDTGEIYIDGKPLRDFSRAALRGAIGLVTQESFLFNGTIRDNLRLGKPDATEEEMLRAAAAANVLELIEKFPTGLDTVVGERGVKVSVGEKQRISIARALLKDPPILILDEATASVDTETERQIQEALDRLMEQRTSFVIAHRLSTVRHADQILV